MHPQTSSPWVQHDIWCSRRKSTSSAKAVAMTYWGCFEKGTRLGNADTKHAWKGALPLTATRVRWAPAKMCSSRHQGPLCCFLRGFSTAGNPPTLQINYMEDFWRGWWASGSQRHSVLEDEAFSRLLSLVRWKSTTTFKRNLNFSHHSSWWCINEERLFQSNKRKGRRAFCRVYSQHTERQIHTYWGGEL